MPRCIKASVHCTQLCLSAFLSLISLVLLGYVRDSLVANLGNKENCILCTGTVLQTNTCTGACFLLREKQREPVVCYVWHRFNISVTHLLFYLAINWKVVWHLQYTIFTWLHMTDSKHTNAKWWNLMHCVVCNWACTMLVSVLDQQAIYFTTIVHMEVVLIADTDEL